MISKRNVKITQTKGFMYDSELESTNGKFEYSQISVEREIDPNFITKQVSY